MLADANSVARCPVPDELTSSPMSYSTIALVSSCFTASLIDQATSLTLTRTHASPES